MADQFDRAQQLDACFRNQALAIHAKAASQRKGASRTICIDCDEPIPQARRIAAPGCLRCIGCEEEHEKQGRR